MNSIEKALLVGAVMWNFADGMLGPLFAIFADSVGGDLLSITWAWSLYLVVTGVGVILVGKYSDGRNKKHLLLIGYALTTLFTFAYLLVSETWHLLVVQAGLGLSIAFSNPTWSALYDEYSYDDKNGFLWGLADGWMKIALAVAILIGGLLVTYTSFETLFIIMGTLQLLTFIHQLVFLKEKPGI